MLAWIDLETTGLDPEKDQILECALVLTDNDLNVVEELQHVIYCDRDPATCDPVVREMHERNGLWKQVSGKEAGVALPMSLNLAEQQFLRVMRRWVEIKTVPMCGSSIGFDRVFLRRYMPKFEAYFHRRIVDVSSIGEVAWRWHFDVWNKRPRGDGVHRALPDVLGSIELLRYWRSNVFKETR